MIMNVTIDQEKIQQLESKIKDSRNTVIIPHVNSDGDAIGSVLGLYFAIKNEVSSNIKIISPNKYPKFLQWMPENDKIDIYNPNKPNPLADADLIITTDFNALNRLGKMKEVYIDSAAYKVVIDHHPEPEDFADLLFIDTTYSSTAELIYDIIKASSFSKNIDKNCAICLFTGILTDTGSFNFNSSNPNTYRVVADLLDKGIDKDKIFYNVYNNFSESRMRFLGNSLLNGMTYLPEYNTGYIVVTAKDRDDFKEQVGDTENFVNYPLSIKGCVFSAIFIERNNFIKMSFRSKGNFSAGAFAKKHFNGGGHKNAAGGECHKSLDSTVTEFHKALKEYKNELTENNVY